MLIRFHAWKRITNLLNIFWTKFYPSNAIEMPRTDRRRQHSRSRSRSSGGYREKRRRIEIEDNGAPRERSIDSSY
uniref:Uncharacterized protein n=1 Tax=Lutzomyia longipalpis TaxID=7200 RepID=A0A1B0CQQ1_LUTLO